MSAFLTCQRVYVAGGTLTPFVAAGYSDRLSEHRRPGQNQTGVDGGCDFTLQPTGSVPEEQAIHCCHPLPVFVRASVFSTASISLLPPRSCRD